jgi:hypothetical protein
LNFKKIIINDTVFLLFVNYLYNCTNLYKKREILKYYRQVAILISIGVIFGIVYAGDDDRNVYAVNATEFLMNAQGFFNTTISFSFNTQTMMPNITGQYSNEEFGIANVVFKDGWTGLINPTQKGLLSISLTPGALDDNSVRQAGGVIPQFSLYVVNKVNYEGPLDGLPPTFEQQMKSMSPEELNGYQQFINSMSKQRGVPVEQIEEELKDLATPKCKNLEESSTSVINGKKFDITSKECSTPLGTPFLHKTYLYEDNDRIHILSMHGIQYRNMFCSGGGEFGNEFGNSSTEPTMNEQIEQCIKNLGKPSLQIYLPALDETAKSLEIS